MKLSEYARKMGVRYETAWRWFGQGDLPGQHLSSGTIVVFPPAEGRETHPPRSAAAPAGRTPQCARRNASRPGEAMALVPRWPPAASSTSRTVDRIKGDARHARVWGEVATAVGLLLLSQRDRHLGARGVGRHAPGIAASSGR